MGLFKLRVIQAAVPVLCFGYGYFPCYLMSQCSCVHVNLAQRILSIFYILMYIVNLRFKTKYFIFARGFGCLCNIFFIKARP
jgi:hypothetical protein